MFLTWLHKIWKFFLTTIVVLLLTIMLGGGLLFGLLQLPVGKEYMAEQIVNRFNQEYEGYLEIEDITGIIPIRPQLNGLSLYESEDHDEPVLTAEYVAVRVSAWDLIRRNISIHSFELQSPFLKLEKDSLDSFTVANAFKRTSPSERPPRQHSDLNGFEILAPSIRAMDGRISAANIHELDIEGIPSSFEAENVEADLFLEFTYLHRILDINLLQADLPGHEIEYVNLSGQIFDDDHYLEMNAFQFQTTDLFLEFSAEAYPVSLMKNDLVTQFSQATYRLNIDNSLFGGRQISRFFPDYPYPEMDLGLVAEAEGTFQNFYLDRLFLASGESMLQLTGELENIDSDDFSYSASIGNLVLHPDQVRVLAGDHPGLGDEQIEYLSKSLLNGTIRGTNEIFESNLNVNTERGNLRLELLAELDNPLFYTAEMTLDSLDLSPVFPQQLQRNHLNGRVSLKGSGFTADELQADIHAEIDSSYINHIEFHKGLFEGTFSGRSFTHTLSVENGASSIQSSGRIANPEEEWMVTVDGQVRNIDLRHLLQNDELPVTSINLDYSTDLQWSRLDDLFGRLSFEADQSVIGNDTLRSHQLYADINPPFENDGHRQLRLTSSFLDAEVDGDIYPENLVNLYKHWQIYLKHQFAEEVLMDTTETIAVLQEEPVAERAENVRPANLNIQMDLKDLTIIQTYFTENPMFESDANINLNLDIDADQVLMTGSLDAPSLRYKNFISESLSANITSNFRHAEKFSQYGTVDLQVNAGHTRYNNLYFDEGYLNVSMRNDSLYIYHLANRDEDDLKAEIGLTSKLNTDSVDITLQEFNLGTDQYHWVTEGTPRITYFKDQTLQLDHLNFVSDEERIEIDGLFSNNIDDQVTYNIKNLNLQRISELIGGRVIFAGTMDGQFATSTLAMIPTFEGRMGIKQFSLNERLVGDINFNSVYSSEDDRFNTNISVKTNPENYPEYYAENDSIGQNLVFDGYFRTPDVSNPDEEFFYFDAEFHEIDMWIVTVIVPMIIEETEGSSTGSGYIRGSLSDFDFNADFDIRDVKAQPVFTNTRYNLNGKLNFNRYDGLIFEEMTLEDDGGGTGFLTGTIDLDDFSDFTYLDLTLDMDNLHFMNNPYDPDIPFYSTARGTGQARITGSNFNPFLRTTEPVVITPGSRISVPVADEAELQQSQKFIQFVDSFDWSTVMEQERTARESGSGPTFQFDPETLTFAERFTLDLQFIAQDPVNFRLIFDRVTNEMLRADGTGQIRLTLEDQNFSIFGRMNITGGDYQFVAGDIISRRFDINEGGSIIWEGDPANARLDISASYRARPDITSLLASGRSDLGQRVPIDLVLNIGGTISELENDFFFQVPSSIEGTLDPALLTQINSLNRNEEEKIIQATSILLSGNFIELNPQSTEGGSGMALRESFTGGAVVNPLITGQFINPLLSDQINSLLNSDISLDIDFNLTQFNEVDLGIALRLYDDRLILRRDGQITNRQSGGEVGVGDLGATYRINRTFAVTAFHRQDPTLVSSSSNEPRQVQEMNGVGLEAQFQFNRWEELRNRFTSAIKRLFGRKDESSDNEDQVETEDPEYPIASDEFLNNLNIINE